MASSEDPDLEGLDPELDVCGACGGVHRPDLVCPRVTSGRTSSRRKSPGDGRSEPPLEQYRRPTPAERALARLEIARARALLDDAILPPKL